MGDIEALRGVWNIVPTPFTPDGAVDTASIPGLVGFVRGTGVDGMTILGVLGEAGRLGDAERTIVLRDGPRRRGRLDPRLRRGLACVHRSRDRARPRGTGRRRPLGHAGAAPAGTAHRCRAAPPLPRSRRVDRPAGRRPGPPGKLRRPDDVRLPPRPRRRGAALPRDQARGGADAAQGRPPRRRLARRHRARRPGRARCCSRSCAAAATGR